VFLWRACSNILPTKDNLLKRGVVNEDLCLFCTRERETVLHTLWECPATKDVWGSSVSCIQKTSGKFFTFVEVVDAMVLKCSSEELSIFASTTKMIWARRNSVVYGGMFMHPTRIVQEVKMSLDLTLSADGKNGECVEKESLLLADGDNDMGVEQVAILSDGENEMVEEQLLPRSQLKWNPPTFGHYKANWGVVLDSKSKRLGCGIVVCDHRGFVIAAQGRQVYGQPEPVHAEAMGALMAAELCRDLGLLDVMLEGDSLQVVQALKCMSQNWSPYGQIVEDARSVLYTSRSWIVSHVKREANSAAHYLAKYALFNVQDRVWMEECRDCISHIVSLEHVALVL
jgi:ribonuclease HI